MKLDIKEIALKCWSVLRNFFKRIWQWYKGLYKGAPWYKKTIVAIISLIVAFVFYLFAVNVNLFWLFGKSPSVNDIMHPETNEASQLYSADGKLIGKYFNENRTPVSFDDINPTFFKVLIDTEDERFYKHHGIDFQGLAAAFKDMIGGHARGASTITQQLVKNMFRVRTHYSTGLLGKVPGLKIIIMKSKEMFLAVEIEMLYSKEEILTMYANTVDFGSNSYGIKTAAKTYFNTTPKDLTIEQSAVLVGLLKATSTYNPRLNPERSLERRNVVLSNMLRLKDITKQEYDSLSQLDIHLNYRIETAYDGQALYFRQAVAKELKPWCEETGYDLYTDGLKIFTTLDSRMQEYAEQAVKKQMRVVQNNFRNHWGNTNPWQDEQHREIKGFIEDLAKRTDAYKELNERYHGDADSIDYYMNKPHRVRLFDYDGGHYEEMSSMDSIRYMVRYMHTGFVAIEPQTGEVKAWVGDVDFSSWKYDKVTAKRQPGSTFKLFVYTAAMNAGLTPCDYREDSYVEYDATDSKGKPTKWRPHNANGFFSGAQMPLKAAFAQSINSVAVKVGMEVGIHNVIETAHKMGIKSSLTNAPSITLGSCDVSLLELVNSYCTVANDGKMHDPVLVTKILDRHGNVVYEAKNTDTQAIPYRSAYLMQKMLLGGLTEPGGTSMSLWGYISPFARDTDFGGKTGTSNNHSDSWFVGVTPNLVCGAWVGGEYRCIHFRTGALGQGSRTALPICGYFLQSVLGDSQFKRYHGKFGAPKESIDAAAYTCQGCVFSNDSDSVDIAGDSLDVDILTADPAEMGIGDDGQTTVTSDPPEGENPDLSE
ncbi:MAG: transglycosylase domain-containing protein [Muribaculaceae bacterium]